jgi:small subunit ribosomal protein S4e
MAHIKKTVMPKTWPVPRKGRGKRFVAVPSHGTGKGISLLFLIRDVLGVAKTRKEVRHMTLNGMVKINNKVRHDENFPVNVLDVLKLDASAGSGRREAGGALYYRLEIVNKKFNLVKIDAKEADSKIVKIIGKSILSGGLVQMNLRDGQNFLSKVKFSVGDSVLLDTKKNVVSKILNLKKGAKVEIISGKHAGEKGELVGFEDLTRGRNYEIKLENSNVKLPYKTILVIG